MNKIKRIFLILFMILLIFSSHFSFAALNYADLPLTVYSPSCVLMDSKTGTVIYEENAKEQMSPASTTKIMTAILALENCKLTDVATVSYNAVHSIPSGYSYANLKVEEELTIEELLNVLLIPSANDAAVVLAEHIAGSVESFATMMNTKATEIGCVNTNFLNPNGIEQEGHYSCAYDLALMGKYAMQNDIFRSLVSKTRYTLPITNKHEAEDRIFNTTNELLKVDNRNAANNYYYAYCNGIKTGYTDKAKNCIVASAKQDDREFIVAILGADRTDTGLFARAIDCKNLFDFAFKNYEISNVMQEGTSIQKVEIPNATDETKTLNVVIKDTVEALVKKSNATSTLAVSDESTLEEQYPPTITLKENLRAPIAKNSVIGTISYDIDGVTYSSDLLAGEDVILSKNTYTYISIAVVLVLLFLIYKLLHSGRKKTRSKGKKKRKHGKNSGYLYW